MADKSQPFDAYHKWLGISPEEQPADHYRLLGLRRFESDPDVIDAAADRQMAHLKTYKTGRYGAVSQQILNEISAARICLLNPETKQAYDQRLRADQKKQAAAATPVAPVPRSVLSGPALPSVAQHPLPAEHPSLLASAPPLRTAKARPNRSSDFLPAWILISAGAIALVLIVGVLIALINSQRPERAAPANIRPIARDEPKPVLPKNSSSKSSRVEPQVEETPTKDRPSQATEVPTGPQPVEDAAPPPASVTPAENMNPWRRGMVLALALDRSDRFEQNGNVWLRDYSGHDNHGRLEKAELVAGMSAEAVRFTEASQFIECMDTASLNPVEGLTLAAWVRADKWRGSNSDGSILSKDEWSNGGTGGFILRGGGKGEVDFTVAAAGWRGVSSFGGMPTGEWHHIAGTYDGQFLRLYVDGSEEAKVRIDAKLKPSPYPLRLGTGTFAKDRHFLGSVDEAAVWSRALTPEELRQIVDLSKSGGSYCREASVGNRERAQE
jgi:hypothetical protein